MHFINPITRIPKYRQIGNDRNVYCNWVYVATVDDPRGENSMLLCSCEPSLGTGVEVEQECSEDLHLAVPVTKVTGHLVGHLGLAQPDGGCQLPKWPLTSGPV